MRTAAHNMVRHLAAGMAMITCREPLLLAISTNLKTAFTGLLRVGKHLFFAHCSQCWALSCKLCSIPSPSLCPTPSPAQRSRK